MCAKEIEHYWMTQALHVSTCFPEVNDRKIDVWAFFQTKSNEISWIFRRFFLRKTVFIRNSVLMSYFCCICLVQHECIPQAVLGMDILCQAKSGKKSLKLTNKCFPSHFQEKFINMCIVHHVYPQVWERPLCLFWQHCNNWSQLKTIPTCW